MTIYDLFLIEIDRCFQWVCEEMRLQNIHPRQILFGSTVENWMNGEMRLVTTDKIKLPNDRRKEEVEQ